MDGENEDVPEIAAVTERFSTTFEVAYEGAFSRMCPLVQLEMFRGLEKMNVM